MTAAQIKGQLTMFDIHPADQKLRPCDYRFQRYIGQKVQMRGGHIGYITDIFPYYTYVQCGDQNLVGTPYDIAPVWDDR